MKVKDFLFSLLILLNLINCNGQDKEKTIQEQAQQNKHSIIDYFDKQEGIYFDTDKKIIFSSTLIKNIGKFTIYYLPISKETKDYSNNFEKDNKIKPLFDEANSLYYYSEKDRKRISEILRKKIKNETGFKIIGTFIPKNYINIESNEEYTIDFPYVLKYYQKKEKKWFFLLEKKILNIDEDLIFNNKKNLALLDVDKKKLGSEKGINNIFKQWNGVYKYCISDERTDSIKSVTCYEITILNDEAKLDTNTSSCNGKYKIYKNENEMKLVYDESDGDCKDHWFRIKKTGSDFVVENQESRNKWYKIIKGKQ